MLEAVLRLAVFWRAPCAPQFLLRYRYRDGRVLILDLNSVLRDATKVMMQYVGLDTQDHTDAAFVLNVLSGYVWM